MVISEQKKRYLLPPIQKIAPGEVQPLVDEMGNDRNIVKG